MNEDKLATELLRELKTTAKRWFIIAMVELLVIAGLIVFMFVVPVDVVEVTNEDGNANYVGRDLNGELYNGESKENTPSGEAGYQDKER